MKYCIKKLTKTMEFRFIGLTIDKTHERVLGGELVIYVVIRFKTEKNSPNKTISKRVLVFIALI